MCINAEMANVNRSELLKEEDKRFNLSSIAEKWSRCSGFEKLVLIVAMVVIVLCIFITIIISTTKSFHKHNEEQSFQKIPLATGFVVRDDKTKVSICEHKDCTIAAADILNAMDESVNPCQDFVKFSCGGWGFLNPIPQDSSSWDQFSTLRRRMEEILSIILEKPPNESDPLPIEQLKSFYSGCLNDTRLEEVGLQPLVDLISSFGGWPITNVDWIPSKFDKIKVLGKMRSRFGVYYVLATYVRTDNKDTMKNALYIDQPTLGLPRSVLLSPENYKDRVAAYKIYIKSVVRIISDFIGKSPTKAALDRDVDDILAFETTLANLSSSEEDRRDINKMYNPFTISELQNLTKSSNFNWLFYLQEIFSSTPVNITDKTRVVLMEVSYVKELANLLSVTENRILANYILWRMVKNFGDETVKAMREVSMNYNKIAFGVKSVKSRNVICSGAASSLLGMAVGIKYTEKYFSKGTKVAANGMIQDIKNSFMHLLETNGWMDPVTKRLAKEKLNKISNAIGYPDWYLEPSGIEDYYKNLTGIKHDMHFENLLTLRSYNSLDYLSKLNLPADRLEWSSSPSDVNAYYEPAFNSITFPAGILQPPFYRAKAPQYLNYGGIGQVIGHEITHGFDDQGRQFNKDGNVIPWWSNKTVEEFQKKIQCIEEQYHSYQVPELADVIPNATMNGKTTLGENIADNGGLRAAYDAYEKYIKIHGEEPRLPGLTKYTPRQLFFIANAQIWCSISTKEALVHQILIDPHSPPDFRITGPISNMKEFSDVWGCPLGSKMNPENKCIVW